MDISQNHVSYDESQHTLTVTTFYNERTFLTLCFEKILFHKRPPIPGRTNGCRDSYYNFLKIVLFILLGYYNFLRIVLVCSASVILTSQAI